MDFHQTVVNSASWGKGELFSFWGQMVKGQGYTMTKYAKNTIVWVCFRDVSGVHWWIFTKLVYDEDELISF